jgi:hypothetical protein
VENDDVTMGSSCFGSRLDQQCSTKIRDHASRKFLLSDLGSGLGTILFVIDIVVRNLTSKQLLVFCVVVALSHDRSSGVRRSILLGTLGFMLVTRLDRLKAIDLEKHQRARKDYVSNMVTTKVSGIQSQQ